MEKEGRRCERCRKQQGELRLLTFHSSGAPSFSQAAWIESINMYLSSDHKEVDGCKTYPNEFTNIYIIYIYICIYFVEAKLTSIQLFGICIN